MSARKHFLGEQYGRLELVGVWLSRDKHGHARALCRCDCGSVKTIPVGALQKGATLSCGCLNREQVAKLKLRHGHYRDGRASPTYKSFMSMLARCNNPKREDYERYGGRGIRVCDRWREPDGQGFVNFLADLGARPEGKTLDRVDNEGNYEPGNCRWATPKEQRANQRPRKRDLAQIAA